MPRDLLILLPAFFKHKPCFISTATKQMPKVNMRSVGTQTDEAHISESFEFSCEKGDQTNDVITFVSLPKAKVTSSQTEHNEFRDKSTETLELEEVKQTFNIQTDAELKSLCGISLAYLSLISEMIGSLINDGRKISKMDKLLLFFMKLKFNLPFLCLGILFGIDRRTASDIFTNVLDSMHNVVKKWIWWIPKESVKATMPTCFKQSYPNCRVIIDASEVRCECPSSVKAQGQFS